MRPPRVSQAEVPYPSYLPVVLLNLIYPVVPLGRSPVVPKGILIALVPIISSLTLGEAVPIPRLPDVSQEGPPVESLEGVMLVLAIFSFVTAPLLIVAVVTAWLLIVAVVTALNASFSVVTAWLLIFDVITALSTILSARTELAVSFKALTELSATPVALPCRLPIKVLAVTFPLTCKALVGLRTPIPTLPADVITKAVELGLAELPTTKVLPLPV